MIGYTKDGREVEFSVFGRYEDDLTIDDAYFVDSDEEVSQQDIDYIEKNYAQEIYEKWLEDQIARAEDRAERDMER
jgi:hypothetical protein